MKILVGLFWTLSLVPLFPLFLMLVLQYQSIPYSVKKDPEFQEIYNETFETQQELFICEREGVNYLENYPCSNILKKVDKGTTLHIIDIVKKNSPFVGTTTKILADIKGAQFGNYKSIDAKNLLIKKPFYQNVLVQFDPKYLKNSVIKSLQTAALYKDLEAIKKLVHEGFNINHKDFNGKTALHYATDLGIVEELVKNGAHVNIQDLYQNTPLLLAADSKHFDIVIFLLECGADPNIKGKDNSTILLKAAENNRLDIVDLTLKFGAEPLVAIDSMSGILFAARNKNFEMVKRFIELGASPNSANSHGNTALHYAIDVLSIIQLLVDHGADVNLTNNRAKTPLHVASRYPKNLEVAEYLYEKGANINQADEDGETPLFEALYSQNHEIAKWLIEHGAYLDIPNKKGITAFQLAEKLEASFEI